MHLGVAVNDLEAALPGYERIFGYKLLSGPFEDPIQRVRICFVGAADDIVIELVAPLSADSPVKRILAKGGGAYHTCYETPDIERAIPRLLELGCVAVSDLTPAVAFAGRRIAWLFTPSRQLLEIVER
jgi:methylmalonyl-CoA/ethylmalonyl-CoA epimerase